VADSSFAASAIDPRPAVRGALVDLDGTVATLSLCCLALRPGDTEPNEPLMHYSGRVCTHDDTAGCVVRLVVHPDDRERAVAFVRHLQGAARD